MEVKTIVERNYKKAKDILEKNRDKLRTMAEGLITYETLDSKQIADIMAGKKPRKPKGWSKGKKKIKKAPEQVPEEQSPPPEKQPEETGE